MLDTEGFAATNISENYDAKIFAVSTLLSSTLLFNSVKIIDQSDIDYLELLARRTQLFALKAVMAPRANLSINDRHDSKESKIELDSQIIQFPSLIWVIQDFVQDVEGETNCKNWLIQLLSTHTRETESYSISLKDIFPSVDCHTLFIPSANKYHLADLSRADENELLMDYRYERDELIAKLNTMLRPKYRNSIPMTGTDLVHIFRMLVNAANSGSLTEIPNRWDAFLDRLKQSSIEECFKFYATYMNNLLVEQARNEPVSMSYLQEWHQMALQKSSTLLQNLLQGLESHLQVSQQQLGDQIRNSYILIKTVNKQKIQMRTFAIRKKLETEIANRFLTIKYPVLTEDIKNFATMLKPNISEQFYQEMESLVPKNEMSSDIEFIERFIDLTADSSMLENNKHLDKYFDENIQSSITDGLSKLQINTVRPKILSKFIAYIDELESNVREMFENRVQHFAPEVELYNSKIYKLNSLLNEKRQLILQDQENAVGEFLRKEIHLCSTEFNDRISNERLKFPIDFDRFDEIIAQESNRIDTKCIQTLNIYSDYKIHKTIIAELMDNLKQMIAKRSKQNLDAFKQEVETPLSTAKQIILTSKDLYSTFYRFKKFIYDICIIQLNQGRAQEWSLSLKNKVIDSFIKDDPELFAILESKRTIWSTIVGFFQWILSFLGY
ncbi:hypothetical protein BLA29_002575 [Euroglyphus maynei]|uniref:Guanylate-binding protein N-terminal domain-containing protein n=1 Tax=Euroglyphus maynei TaxID=6958 RepID=A0A1Y3BPS8_EURMA|nr:hypothetical protein BLA29_002575 [Euroglyphus maynei]